MLPGLNLLPGENLHSGANCAHEQPFSLSYNYLAGSLINAMTYKCADSPEGYGAFLRLFVCVCFFVFFSFICLIAVLSPRTKAKIMSGRTQLTLQHCSWGSLPNSFKKPILSEHSCVKNCQMFFLKRMAVEIFS